MSTSLSPNTQAILLLTAPLIAGRSEPNSDLLTPGEYKRFARHLHQLSKEPADLLASGADAIVQDSAGVIESDRLRRLLGRGFALSQAIDRWQSRAIWVVSRADADYPQRLKDRLREDRPAILYGCGERSILDRGGLAVVGSRDVDDALVEYTQAVGRLTAKARKALVSGGARGIDQAAMRGALEAGGMVSGVLADSLEKSAMNREHRSLLMEGQLVLISPYDPGAGFNVGNAMQRNKLIYAFSDAALVVNSDFEKGGTWAGAVEQLGKLKLVPVYVRSTGQSSKAFAALIQKGALPWPNPEDADGLVAVLEHLPPPTPSTAMPSQLSLTGQDSLLVTEPVHRAVLRPITALVTEAPVLIESDVPAVQAEIAVKGHAEPTVAEIAVDAMPAPTAESNPADELAELAKKSILRVLKAPKTMGELVDALRITETQLKVWLNALVEDGTIRKTKKKNVLYELPAADLIDLCTSSGATKKTDSKP